MDCCANTKFLLTYYNIALFETRDRDLLVRAFVTLFPPLVGCNWSPHLNTDTGAMKKCKGAYTVRHTRVSLHVYEWNRNKRCVLTLQRSTETAFDIKCFRHVNSHRLRLSKIKGPTGQTRTHTRIGNCEVDGLAVITKWAGSVRHGRRNSYRCL